MNFVWTKNHKFFGKDLIVIGLGEPVSHLGIEWTNGMVSHWSLGGYEYLTKEQFYKKRTKVLEMDFLISEEGQARIIEKFANSDHDDYDYYYMWWLTFHAIARLASGTKIPYGETSDNPDNVICHEAIEEIPEKYRPKYDPSKANTPYRLYLALLAAKELTIKLNK
jgi:hypothetical protein